MTKARFRQIYAVAIIASIIIATIVLFFVAPPQENRSVVDMVLGALIGAFGSVVKDLYKDANEHTEKELKNALIQKYGQN